MSLALNAATPDATWKEGYLVRMRMVLSGSPVISPGQSPGTQKVISNASLLALVPKGPLRGLLDFTKSIPAAGIAASAVRTQAQARALLMSDDPTEATLTSPYTPRAIMFFGASRSTSVGTVFPQATWSVDASVDASGKPTVIVRGRSCRNGVASNTSAMCPESAYLTLQFCNGSMR